jgi:VWFA-related protein
MRKKFLSGLAVLAAVLGAALHAQGTPAGPAPRVGDSIDVRVVNVEVVVTDRWGKRVTDLKPGDFRLKVDGKPVSVEYFTEVRDSRAVAPASSGEAASAATLPGIEPGETIGTNYLVFIDSLFSIQQHRNIVLSSMKKELSQLGPGDRVSIVAWDGGKLVRLAGWTGSREEIVEALDRAMKLPSHGVVRRIELQRLLSDLSDASGISWDDDDQANEVLEHLAGNSVGLTLAEVAYARVLGYQIASASHAVISTMRGSSVPPGRKVLLLLSGGWPFSLESYLRGDKPLALSRELSDNLPALKMLADTANLLGYTIYPVDVPGVTSAFGDITHDPLDKQGSVIMGNGTSIDGASYSGQAPPPSTYTSVNSFRDQETEGTLYYLAKQTGGKPLLNGNRELALGGAKDDTRSYYWLGFTPDWQRDGKAHRVTVEMTKRGLRARSRQGFLDLTRGAEAGMKVESALLFGDLPEGKPLELHLGTAVKGAKRGVTDIPLTVDIPVEAVTVLPAEGQYMAQAQLRLIATDEQGNQSTLPTLGIKLTAPKQPEPGAKLRYTTTVHLRGRANQLVAAVYDPVTGSVAAGKADISLR